MSNDADMNQNHQADRLTFWRNWYQGARQLPDEMRLAWYDAVLDFAFASVEPTSADCKDAMAALKFQAVQMVRSTIEISRSRRKAGESRGSKRKAKRKQTEANPKQTEANPKQEQVQVQEQEQEQYANSIKASSAHARGMTTPTIEQFIEGGRLAGVPEDFARAFYGEIVARGWEDVDGRRVGNWRTYVRKSYLEFQKKSRGACEVASPDFASVGIQDSANVPVEEL